MTEPQVCVLVLNWNGRDDTLACLETVTSIDYPNFTPLVVDNGSTDDSVKEIRAAYPEIELLELPENLLYGGGNNAGLKWAREKGFEFVLFLNNDTLVEPDLLKSLMEPFENGERCGLTVPLILYADRTDLVWYGGGKVNLWTGEVSHDHIRKSIDAVPQKNTATEYATGCCFLIRTELASQLEGFDPWFSMYGEDVDLSLRLRSLGYDLIFVPSGRMYHKVSASMGGEFNRKKLIRKGLGLLKIYGRHAQWYQWPILILGQALMSVKYLLIILQNILKPRRGTPV